VTSSVAAVGTGVTASVNTANGESTLALASRTAGAAGVVTVSSSVTATTVPALTYNDLGTASTYSAGNVGEVAKSGDTLSGTLSVQVGNGATENIVIGAAPSGGAAANTLYTGTGNTLADVVSTIQGATGLDFSASVVTNSDGSSSLQLVSLTGGTAGALTVSSSLQDVTATTTTSMDYSNSSDINSLTSLGISVNNDGSLTFDASSLDSVLNTDYSGVMGFFQYPESWGQNFNTMLTNSGTTAGTGVLALASTSNSNIESTLNADISKENLSISSQQASLTAELNSANEIMQQLPSQLSGVNELYSAITGYNQNTNG
jgi:flagellar hook-associated protein 2